MHTKTRARTHMYTARQLPIIMGLSSAALMLIVTVSISTPFATLCIYSCRYSLPAIKSVCVEYVHSMWSLLSRPVYDSKEPIIITPRNIFLLVNLIILFLFISMHVQQLASAAEKRSSRKKRQQHREKLIMDNKQAAPLQPLEGSSLAGSTAAAAMVSEALSISSEIAAELSPLQAPMESSENQSAAAVAGSLEETLTVDSDRINSPDVEQIVLEEDGRLRLIEGPISPKGSDAEKLEDRRLRLIDSTNGADEEKIVLEKDGRLRLMDTPLPSYSKPEKSLSYPSDSNHNTNYDTHSLNDVNYDMHISLNSNHNVTHDTFTNKSSSLKRTSSKPMRVKKSDSLDATWKAMNHNKGSAVNADDRDHKPLIRQSSRTDFKPNRGGRGGVMKATNSRVRREPSISQEELNAKVESFIAKFNEQIRIERQQSILSFMQMVDRGA